MVWVQDRGEEGPHHAPFLEKKIIKNTTEEVVFVMGLKKRGLSTSSYCLFRNFPALSGIDILVGELF